MTLRSLKGALAASTLFVLPWTGAHAQDAEAVATALATAMSGGDAARGSYSGARAEGGNVVIDGLTIRQSEGADTVTFATTTVTSPEEGEEAGSYTSSSIQMTDGTLTGETTGTIESVGIENATIRPAAGGTDGDAQGLTFDSAEASGISVKPADQTEPMTAERVAIRMANVVDGVPQSSSGSAEAILVPASYFAAGGGPGPQALGYDNVTLDLSWDGERDPATGNLSVRDLTLGMREGGELSITGEFGNVPVEQSTDPAASTAAMTQATISSLTLRYQDESLAARILDMMAKQQGVSREQYAQQLAAALPFFLNALDNPTFQQQVTSAVGTFLNDPQSLTIRVAPASPVSGAELMQAAQTAPQTLPEVLNLTVEANTAQ